MRGKEKREEEREGGEGRGRQHLRIPSSPALLIPTWFPVLSLGFTSLFWFNLFWFLADILSTDQSKPTC